MRDRLIQLLGSPRLPRWLAGLAILPMLGSLSLGFFGDDYLHYLTIHGGNGLFESDNVLLDLFTFFPGGEGNRALVTAGIIPWWGNSEIHIAFLRPLSAATHVFDHAVFGDNAVLHHAHSLLWFAVAVFVVARFYRRIIASPAVAGLAALLFAVEDARTMPVAWIANRNALITLAFGCLALTLHIRWRESQNFRFLFVALATAALGLAAGEAALGAFAYIAAWQLCMDGPTWRERVRGLAPWLTLGVAYTLIYKHLGYGASGSGHYIDPGGEPLRFLVGAAERWPLLMAAQWFQAPIDIWLVLPREAQLTMALVAVVAVAAIALYLRTLLVQSALARFFALGMALSLVPACGAFPLDRLIVFSGLGAFGLMALMAQKVWSSLSTTAVVPESADSGPPRTRSSGRLLTWTTIALLTMHGPLSLAMLPLRVAYMEQMKTFFASGSSAAPMDSALEEQTLVFVTGSELPVAYTSLIRQATDSGPRPRRLAQLASMVSNNRVTRVDERSLRIEPSDGFLGPMMDRLTHNPARLFEVGQVIVRSDFQAHIDTLTPDGRPASVIFRFNAPLEDPSLRWVAFVDGELEEFPLPSVGETVVVERSVPGG